MPPLRKAVFPAAGLGTRFLPATKASPKEMICLVDKPLIQYVVEEATRAGLDQILIVTGRGKNSIEDHFDVSYELEKTLEEKGKSDLLAQVREISDLIHVAYVRQKKALGLGHAILQAKDWVGDEPFAVLLGDDLVHSDVPAIGQMAKIYEDRKRTVIALMEVAHEETRQYGIFSGDWIDDRLLRVKDLVEKPDPKDAPTNFAVIGRYILTPEIFPILEKTAADGRGEIQLTDALRTLAAREDVYGYRFEGKRYDAGDKLGFLKATVEYALRNPEFAGDFRAYLKGLDL